MNKQKTSASRKLMRKRCTCPCACQADTSPIMNDGMYHTAHCMHMYTSLCASPQKLVWCMLHASSHQRTTFFRGGCSSGCGHDSTTNKKTGMLKICGSFYKSPPVEFVCQQIPYFCGGVKNLRLELRQSLANFSCHPRKKVSMEHLFYFQHLPLI